MTSLHTPGINAAPSFFDTMAANFKNKNPEKHPHPETLFVIHNITVAQRTTYENDETSHRRERNINMSLIHVALINLSNGRCRVPVAARKNVHHFAMISFHE